MRMNFWLICATMVCASLGAQQATNTPPTPIDAPAAAPAAAAPAPAAAEPAPAKKAAKKPATAAAKKPRYELRTTPLTPGPAVVVASNVNVRGQAKLNSEVVGRITKGQEVKVIEEITRNTGPEEPSAWAKINLPANIPVWVHSEYIDSAAQTVKPRRLNYRSGPGENYSVLGRLQRGAAVKVLRTQGDWIQIEAPADAYAFVAAQYLKQEPAGAAPEVATTIPVAATPAAPEVAAATTNEPPPQATTVAEAPTVAAPPSEPPTITTTNVPTETAAASVAAPSETMTATNEPALVEPIVEEPPPPRIVQREGVVRGTLSIQAPTRFELFSPETGRAINYLYTSSRELDLRRYKGLRIIVTGEESLDDRWRNTPVITIQRIQVVD